MPDFSVYPSQYALAPKPFVSALSLPLRSQGVHDPHAWKNALRRPTADSCGRLIELIDDLADKLERPQGPVVKVCAAVCIVVSQPR